MLKRLKMTGLWACRILLGAAIIFCFAVGFVTSGADIEKMRVFKDAAEGWQTNPDFRQVQVEYVELGTTAMRTRYGGVRTGDGILFLRSLPGLPAHIAVNPTSRAHYEKFTSGPLVAYLHLTTETADMLPDTIKMLQCISRDGEPAPEQIRKNFLQQFDFSGYTIATDEGAVESVRQLVEDIGPPASLPVAEDLCSAKFNSMDYEAYWTRFRAAMKTNPHAVTQRYMPYIEQLARELGFPTEPAKMEPEQQHKVRSLLDERIRTSDIELWRLKQINDWANGLWAQVYSTMYGALIAPSIAVQFWARIVGPLLLMGWIALAWFKRRREALDRAEPAGPELAIG